MSADDPDSFIKQNHMMNNIENRLSSHIETTNEKLDILIELTRQMAGVQERQNRHTDDIKRLEIWQIDMTRQMSTLYEKFDNKLNAAEHDRKKTTERIFEKLQEVLNQRLELEEKFHDRTANELEDLTLGLSTLNTEYVSKSNFTKGALWVLGGVLIIAQGLTVSYYKDFKNEFQLIRSNYDLMNDKFSDQQNQINLIIQRMSEFKENFVRKKGEK